MNINGIAGNVQLPTQPVVRQRDADGDYDGDTVGNDKDHDAKSAAPAQEVLPSHIGQNLNITA